MTVQLIGQVLRDPESVQSKPNLADKINADRLAWYYYDSKMFSPGADWSWYLSARRMYKYTKIYFNPFASVVDFYLDNIWSNNLDAAFPNLATPVLDKSNANLINAIQQIDQWTRWRRTQQEVKCFAAITGNVLVEIIDDPENGKVAQRVIWNAFVKDIELNTAEDVVSYTVEYEVYDKASGDTYTFKKIVNKDITRYYKNGKPFKYQYESAEVRNPYGFCPAVWFKHSGSGINGTAAFKSLDKMDALNSLTSHMVGYSNKEMESGKVVGGIEDPRKISILSGATQDKNGVVREVDPELDRVLLAAPGQISVHDLAGTIKLDALYPTWRELVLSFANDYPEIEYRQILKENAAQLSGVALERLLVPAQNRLDRAAANYDEQLIKLRQMQIAIAGWRTRNGWRNLTRQQQVFSTFNLDSYSKGDLDFNLKPSRLIELSEEEVIDLQSKKLDNANKAQGIYPLKERIKMTGISDEKEVDRFFDELSNEAGLQANENGLNNGI